jgi:hypothetical protein
MDMAAHNTESHGVSRWEQLSETVDIDETYLGGKETEGKRGCGTENKERVVAVVEVKSRKIGRIRMKLIDNVSSQSLRLFIRKSGLIPRSSAPAQMTQRLQNFGIKPDGIINFLSNEPPLELMQRLRYRGACSVEAHY